MHRAIWALFLFLPLAAPAQSVITIAPEQCVYRFGDDIAWAAPDLNETGWLPYSQWKLNAGQPRIWVLCHADLSSLRAVNQPAIQVSLWAAYQLYIDGTLAGSAGNVQSGNFSMNTVRSFPLSFVEFHPATIALRITLRMARKLPVSAPPPLELYAGADSALRGQRAAQLLAQSEPNLGPAVGFSVAGVLGVIAFGLFLYDPARRDLFFLALVSICSACTFINYLFASALVAFPSTVYFAAWSVSALAAVAARPVFFFALAGRRMTLNFWILNAFGVLFYVATGFCAFLPPAQALWVDVVSFRYLAFPNSLAQIATFAAPFFSFWPYSLITRRLWPLAGLCLFWAATGVMYFAVRAASLAGISGIPDLVSKWEPTLNETRALIEVCAMVALFVLLFREQRQIALDRAVLAGEMQSASEIQRMLAPATLNCVPGLKIEVAFHPMREVGGDFYLCRVLPDGRQRILTGDVSGKGAAAAMAATLLLGAAAVRDSDQPGILLENLNCLLLENKLAGFATCLCADIAASGEMVIANAGHLPPYLAGVELPMDGGLPLGLTSGSTYSESQFRMGPDQQLTILTDGVVEARNTGGELFGFNRTRQISSQSAEDIARAAQAHGQEDDITVLTLTFAPVGVAHA